MPDPVGSRHGVNQPTSQVQPDDIIVEYCHQDDPLTRLWCVFRRGDVLFVDERLDPALADPGGPPPRRLPHDQARPAEGAARRARSALRNRLRPPAIENTEATASQRPGMPRFPVAWIR